MIFSDIQFVRTRNTHNYHSSSFYEQSFEQKGTRNGKPYYESTTAYKGYKPGDVKIQWVTLTADDGFEGLDKALGSDYVGKKVWMIRGPEKIRFMTEDDVEHPVHVKNWYYYTYYYYSGTARVKATDVFVEPIKLGTIRFRTRVGNFSIMSTSVFQCRSVAQS